MWAKARGFPYWPAKVLRAVKDDLDIRFFGAHDRLLVKASGCYWLSKECPGPCRASISADFKVGMNELDKYIEKLRATFGSFTYAPFKAPFDINNLFTFVDKYPGKSF